uniref:Uncharacterized protein n=1 Tax=Auxenochlorella protothecoides TaxID=3075 RepID=A0A1D2A5V1_AUXPR
MGDGLKATPVLRPINSNLAAVSGWGKGTVDGSRAPRAVAHRPHSRRDGIPLRPGTGRQPSKVRLSVRLRVDAWQAGDVQLDSDELKDTILFQATRQRAAALQISLRQGSGRHHVRRPTQVALPPLPPPPPEVTEEETVLQEEEGAAAASVAGMAAEGQARPAATPPVQLAPHPSPACTMPASSQGRPSRSQTRVEGVPEWFTAARGEGPRRSAPLRQPRATPRPAFTPVEGVPERDSVAGPGAGWPRGWLHMAGGGADAGDGDPATASTGRARSAEGRRGSLDRTLDLRTPEPGDPTPPQPQPGPVPQSDDDDDDNCDFGGQEYGAETVDGRNFEVTGGTTMMTAAATRCRTPRHSQRWHTRAQTPAWQAPRRGPRSTRHPRRSRGDRRSATRRGTGCAMSSASVRACPAPPASVAMRSRPASGAPAAPRSGRSCGGWGRTRSTPAAHTRPCPPSAPSSTTTPTRPGRQ